MWKEENNQLKKSFQFSNFVEALAFKMQVTYVGEKLELNANWDTFYDNVEVKLFTPYCTNRITEKDREFSIAIDEICEKIRL